METLIGFLLPVGGAVVIIAFMVIKDIIKQRRAIKNWKDYTGPIMDILGCEYETITDAADTTVVMNRYKDLLSQGKMMGFTPVAFFPDKELYETLQKFILMDDYAYTRKSIIEEAAIVNVAEFLADRIEKYDIKVDGAPVTDGIQPENEFVTLLDMRSWRPKKEAPEPPLYPVIVIAKIPTRNPWEVAAWLPMGGVMDCPQPHQQVAIYKHWHETHGAFPAVVSEDAWELYVERPAATQADATRLAKEICAFNPDNFKKSEEDQENLVNDYVAVLLHSSTWYLWWNMIDWSE